MRIPSIILFPPPCLYKQVLLAGMELKDLSNNWKKLQQSLKPTNPPSKKRKAEEKEEEEEVPQAPQQTIPTAKRPRKTHISKTPDSNPVQKAPNPATTSNNGMGIALSAFKKSEPTPSSLSLWAQENDISAKDLAAAYGAPSSKRSSVLEINGNPDERINGGLSTTAEAGKYIGIDCEMVGVGPTPDKDSALARISIVNYHGHQLYDSFVLPKEPVADYRTFVSGITPQLLKSARTLEVVQKDVAKLMDGRILVGHAVRHDLDALLLGHPKRDIRDTSRYPEFRKLAGGRSPSLKKLAREVLGIDIQANEHSSVEDARATMLLFRKEKEGFEREHAKAWGTGTENKKRTSVRGARSVDGKRTKKRARK